MRNPNEVLSSLTADRLEALAAACGDDSMPLALGDAAQVAAALRALAGAERLLGTRSLTLYRQSEPPLVGALAWEPGDDGGKDREGIGPTLISALASVAKQEETNDA